jgi:hypothetical protein
MSQKNGNTYTVLTPYIVASTADGDNLEDQAPRISAVIIDDSFFRNSTIIFWLDSK